jgi:hypothetical protein
MMGKQAANGPFTPAVVAVRAVVGEKQFNQLRGKVKQPPTLPMVAAVPSGRTGRVLVPETPGKNGLRDHC